MSKIQESDDRYWESVGKELRILNDEVGDLRDRVARIKADMVWTKWLVTGITGRVIALIFRVFAY